MKLISFLLLMLLVPSSKSVYDYKMKDIDGKEVSLANYKGKVLLFVNVASFCGNTPQYKDIEALYKKYNSKGLVVLGFPANNFMSQEPGSDKEIKQFCTKEYAVTFPIFSKISVKGKDIHPLYQYLTTKEENGTVDSKVDWNFHKFLVGRDGKVISSISARKSVNEADVIAEIEAALNAK